MADRLRRVLLGSWLSYRALFTWLNPWGYVSSRIVMPIALTLIFGTVSQAANGSPRAGVVGGTLLAVALAEIYGVTLAVANERTFGTLGAWLATPQPLGVSLLVKTLPHVVDGLLNAALTLSVASAAFRLGLSWTGVGIIVACAATTAVSTAGLGMVTAAFALRFRDVFTAPNLVEALLLITSGVIAPQSALPGVLAAIGSALPLSRTVRAAQEALAGGDLEVSLMLADIVMGLVWGLAGYLFLSRMVRNSRSSGRHGLV